MHQAKAQVEGEHGAGYHVPILEPFYQMLFCLKEELCLNGELANFGSEGCGRKPTPFPTHEQPGCP
jgi:hypothetical protein